MKITIDTKNKIITTDLNGKESKIDLYSREGFEIISEQWLKVGWNQKYPYAFSWMGRPVIQLPEDMIRAQEVIYKVKPDILIETGVAHGGSLIFYASLFKAMGKGRVVGVDIEIRPHNRKAIEAHEMFPMITLLEGSSTAPETFAKVKSLIKPNEKVMVILDSNHTKEHVLNELELYHPLVSKDSYIVATDGSMQILHDVPRGTADWKWNNPVEAAVEFAAKHKDFAIEQPAWPFNESELRQNITHWPSAWLYRK